MIDIIMRDPTALGTAIIMAVILAAAVIYERKN